MSLKLADLLEKSLISDLALWNNGCISQGRLTAVTSISQSPWLSRVPVCFSFTSQVRTVHRRFYGPHGHVVPPPSEGLGNVT